MSDDVDSLAPQLIQCQQKLYAYILTLVGDVSTADDVLQETNVVLWAKRREYDPSLPLLNWAMRIAYYQVLAHRTRRGRARVRFSDALLETVAAEAEPGLDELDRRRVALADCVHKLPDTDRDLIRLRYDDALSAGQIADRVNRSVDAVYQAMRRIRLALMRCARAQMTTEDAR
ncbi:MAG: sigma-70 family RNA polymerase sigma factor [Phycisphaera sp.]|nr:sigma-70 family RNA polymerase sigma factor [Phycisphaera sp.]